MKMDTTWFDSTFFKAKMFYYIVRIQLETGYTIVWMGTSYDDAIKIRDSQQVHSTITCYETDDSGKVVSVLDVSRRF